AKHGGAMANMPMPMPAPGMWMANPMMGNLMSVRQATVRLKLGENDAKSLKALKGTLTAKALADSEALITVDNVLSAAGKTVKGASGGSVQVHAIDKTANGDYQVQARLENLPGSPGPMMMPGGGQFRFQQIQIQIGGNVGGNIVMGAGM